MRSQNFLRTVFRTLLFYQTYICVSTARNTTICDINDIPQCILCAYCENPTNKTKRFCHQPAVSKYFDENPSLSIKEDCYEYGDHADFFLQRSHISILPPDEIKEGPRMCYFNISFYNASQTQSQYFDTACVEYGSGKHKTLSKNELWKVNHKWSKKWPNAERLKYDVEATKGLAEGVYQFHFNNSRLVDQIYISKKRQVCFSHSTEPHCSMNDKNHLEKIKTKIINPSWDLTSSGYVIPFTYPLENYQIKERQNLTVDFPETYVQASFQNCLNYLHSYNKEHDDSKSALQIELFCWINDPSSGCSCNVSTFLPQNNEHRIMITLSDVAFCKKENKYQQYDIIRVNIFCRVQGWYTGYHYGYGYNQPVILSFNHSTPTLEENDISMIGTGVTSTVSNSSTMWTRLTPDSSIMLITEPKEPPNLSIMSTDETTFTVVVSILAIGVGVLVLFLYHRSRPLSATKNEFTALKEWRSGRWVSNPDYISTSSSSSQPMSEDDEILPEWMRTRKDMIYHMSCITRGRELGHGQFGTVFQAQIRLQNAVYPVALKCIRTPKRRSATLAEQDALLDEAKSMLEITTYHDNIVNLQGIAYEQSALNDGSMEFSLILEFCPKSCLKSYLERHETNFKNSLEYFARIGYLEPYVEEENKEPTHDISLLYNWAYQVANGMEFLVTKNIYHGDLAARNVLLTDSLVAKIADFGLARRFYEDVNSDQPMVKPTSECRPNMEPRVSVALPTKWLALEVLLHRKIKPEKSDVWSYGVLTWEIFQLGADPYRIGIDYQDLINELQLGIRLPTPEYCPTSIALLIQACFNEDPNERPTFGQIKETISQSYSSLKRRPEEVVPTGIGNLLNVRYADVQMENRYLMMKKENVELQFRTKITIDTRDMNSINAHQLIEPNTRKLPRSNNLGSYLSLQNMISCDSDVLPSSGEHKCPQSVTSDRISRGTLHPDRMSATQQTNLGFPRNSSYSVGDDNAPLLSERKYYTGLTPAKSYPNPEYILGLADHEALIHPANNIK